jgi:hypothetical protein
VTAAEAIAALEQTPADVELLHELGSAATDDERYVDELFDRLARAAAAPDADRRRIRWAEVCYAALFGRLDVIRARLRDPDFAFDEPLRQAKVGGLLLELGQDAAAEKLLAASGHPLATYHRWRRAARRDDAPLAGRLYAELPDNGPASLRRIAEADGGLRRGDLEPARALVAWWKGPADLGTMASHTAAEIVVVAVELGLAEGQEDDAVGATVMFVAAPARYDPSAILRATALLGSLPRRHR